MLQQNVYIHHWFLYKCEYVFILNQGIYVTVISGIPGGAQGFNTYSGKLCLGFEGLPSKH